MAMDYAARQQATSAARELLKERYNDGNDFADPVRVMYAVRAAAYGHLTGEGEEVPRVPADDVLAALTMLDDARARLDALEHDLLRAARSRDASWATVAGALGLSTRQSAESRALRLERSRKAFSDGRDVAAQRADRTRQRNADAWLVAHEERIRTVCGQIVDTTAAWPHLTSNPLARVHRLAAALALAAAPADPADQLTELRVEIAPYGGPPRDPTGPQAGAAAEARDAMLTLLAELRAVRFGHRDADDIPASADR
ncbi:hypothetical protein [Streptomyces scopuliridis]|uniref:hypothetical protein n=1 Tax=Streptomyces scopuliridis TaxID=452529 RepID=UPI0036853CFB